MTPPVCVREGLTGSAKLVASLQGLRSRQRYSHRDFNWRAGQETSIKEESYAHYREDRELEKAVTRYARDLQVISRPKRKATQAARLPDIHKLQSVQQLSMSFIKGFMPENVNYFK